MLAGDASWCEPGVARVHQNSEDGSAAWSLATSATCFLTIQPAILSERFAGLGNDAIVSTSQHPNKQMMKFLAKSVFHA